jgi:hypothetical protein
MFAGNAFAWPYFGQTYAGTTGAEKDFTATVSASTAVSCTLVRVRARVAAINGSTAVSCTLTRTRARAAAVNGSTTVTASIHRTRARSATATGSTTISCVLTTFGTKFFTATIHGSTTVTADLVQPSVTPGTGGFVFSKRPPIRKPSTVKLRPVHATVAVTAFAPRLIITEIPGAPVVRTRPLAPMPTLIFQAAAVSSETLGELPRSKRDLIDKVVIYDTV